MLVELDEILKNKKEVEQNKIGIYFLLKDNIIVYVGKTTQGLTRVFTHLKDKEFDNYYFKPCKLKKLEEIEFKNIVEHRPKYNKALNEEFITVNNISNRMKKYGIKSPYYFQNNILEIIKENKIKIVKHTILFDETNCIQRKDFDFILNKLKKASNL